MIPRGAVIALPAAWVIHDLEELVTAQRWSELAPDLIRRRLPFLHSSIVRFVPITTSEMGVAISIVGLVLIGATLPALKAERPLIDPYRIALAGYSLHGATHLAQSAMLRNYTPGLATTPVFVLGYSTWAWSALRRAGFADGRDVRRAFAVAAVVLPALAFIAQALGRLPGRRRPPMPA